MSGRASTSAPAAHEALIAVFFALLAAVALGVLTAAMLG